MDESSSTSDTNSNRRRRDFSAVVALLLSLLIHSLVIGGASYLVWRQTHGPGVAISPSRGGAVGSAVELPTANQNKAESIFIPGIVSQDSQLNSADVDTIESSENSFVAIVPQPLNPPPDVSPFAALNAGSTVAPRVRSKPAAEHRAGGDGLALVAAPVPGSANRPPIYPQESMQNHEAGTVLVKIRIDATGAVQSVELVRSSGFPRLDQAALQAVAAWKFSPAMEEGKPIGAEFTQPIEFKLRQSR